MKATPGDAAVIALAAALVGGLFAAFWGPPAPAAWAEVRSGDVIVGRYALDRARTVEVAGRLGASRLALEPGRARFVTGPCRNQVCVHSGWLRHDGEAAACLPNGVSVALSGGAMASLDAISY